jgi:hypothetical protein
MKMNKITLAVFAVAVSALPISGFADFLREQYRRQ